MTSTSTEVRQRKPAAAKRRGGSPDKKGPRQRSAGDEEATTLLDVLGLVKAIVWLLGLAALICSGLWIWNYMQTLHENQLWFSNIRQVEREISLRTECGLYYSYYKQLVDAPSLQQGIMDLTKDNITEHGRTINILERFNIYQEVVLAGIYRMLNVEAAFEPILFYVYSCFFLTGLYVSLLFALAWYLSGSWMAGVLTAVYFTVSLDDATRVFFTVNLREVFAFPFLFAQIFYVCVYLERKASRWRATDAFLRFAILATTSKFALMWQFNQFVLLIQALALYFTTVLELAPVHKVRHVLYLQAFALIGVWVLQFGQPMLLGSLLMSFIPAAVLSMYLCKNVRLSGSGFLRGVVKLVLQCLITAFLTVAFNVAVKSALRIEADAHIFKFVKGKLGLADPLDFESKIYLCHGAFAFLEREFFQRTSRTLLFPVYLLLVISAVLVLGKDLIDTCVSRDSMKKSKAFPQDISDKQYFFNRRPNLAYLIIQSCLFGAVAVTTLRMKYLWFPHMAVLASVLLCDFDIWTYVFAQIKIRSKTIVQLFRFVVPLLLASYLVWQFVPTYRQQMEDLKEFWDPDTVDLMEWINNSTKPDASFTGSMQLLAGVKCCTGRHVTNHPHFEDKWLRERTKQVYQIYGRKQPKEVFDILKSAGTDYIILEDSICLANSDGCRTPDLMDLTNGHIPQNGYTAPGLTKSSVPRFCDQIRHGHENYAKYFRRVFENKTFRVYELVG